jgi:hypothetical protein
VARGEGKNEPPAQKYRRRKMFRSGPGAIRTRDLLLRSAGPIANHRQPSMRNSELGASLAYWR